MENNKIIIYRKLFTELYKSLHEYSCTITGRADESEDCVMVAFATLWNNFDRVNDYDHGKNLLYKMVKQRSIDYVNSARRKSSKPLPDEFDVPAHEESITEAERVKQIEQLRNGVEKLPPKCRDVMQRRMAGHSWQRISADMNISYDTVFTHIHNAVIKLKKTVRRV
jgi:RNA polymerase sigma factor (sigma-70 family)